MEQLGRRIEVIREALAVLDGLVGLSAVTCGLGILMGLVRLPGVWTDSMSYLFTGDSIPSLLLVVVVGGACLGTVFLLLRSPGSGSAYVATYCALIVVAWMVVEAVSLGPVTWLEPLYGTLTALIAVLSFLYLWAETEEEVPAL